MYGELIAAALALIVVAAQITTGALTGTVLDEHGSAMRDATVTIIGRQGSRAFITDADGRFFAPFLDPDRYDVRVELQGFKAVAISSVRIDIARTTDLRIRLEAADLTSTVEMRSNPAVVDVTSAATGAVLDRFILETLPVGRRVTDALVVAPGISVASHVDALYIESARERATAMPVEFVQGVELKTAAYAAEFGQSVGAIATIATRSGANQHHGMIMGSTQPAGLEEHDAGAFASGRVAWNRAFYFAGLDQRWVGSGHGTSYAAKFTYQLARSQRLDVSLAGDFSKRLEDDHNEVIRYSGRLGRRVLVETQYAHAVDNGQFQSKATYLVHQHELKAGILFEGATADPIWFLQDRFNPHERLTISAGLRYESDWAPRIGAAYDPLGNGRSRFYAHWGRFFGPLPFGLDTPDVLAECDEAVAGYEIEALGNTALGARFLHRTIADAVELTVDRRFLDNWLLIGSYRWSERSGSDPRHEAKVFTGYRSSRGFSLGLAVRQTSFEHEVSLRGSHTFAPFGGRRFTVVADALNIFNAGAVHERALRFGVRVHW